MPAKPDLETQLEAIPGHPVNWRCQALYHSAVFSAVAHRAADSR
jgi:hypothetical protein